ncbi:hypothetical protein vseg_011282 [Gypsophila vaccaria]
MCEKCEKSLTKVIFRKIGANNTNESADDTIWKCQMHNMQAASNTIMNAKFCRTCAYGKVYVQCVVNKFWIPNFTSK